MSVKSILVTGANRGIGLEFVKQFTSKLEQTRIIATCRNPDNAPELKKLASDNENVHVLSLDVKDYKAYDEFVGQVGDIVGDNGLDVLVNNAGILIRKSLSEVTPSDMMENFEVNAVTPLMLTKSLLNLLTSSGNNGQRHTCVVNITSKMGSIEDNTSGSHYSYRASKTALNMITKSLSVDLKPSGIRCIALHPGWVQTDMGGKNALITTQTSVENMINTILNVNDETNGKMLNYDGKVISW